MRGWHSPFSMLLNQQYHPLSHVCLFILNKKDTGSWKGLENVLNFIGPIDWGPWWCLINAVFPAKLCKVGTTSHLFHLFFLPPPTKQNCLKEICTPSILYTQAINVTVNMTWTAGSLQSSKDHVTGISKTPRTLGKINWEAQEYGTHRT